jgi:hypothetical protein
VDDSAWVYLIPISAIVGGMTIVVVGMLAKARVRELEIKERITMIERGLVPPPEKDPQGFERAMSRHDRSRGASNWDYDARARSPRRYRSGGITLMGVGFGLMLLIGLAAGSPETGIGIGGFLVILGIAFVVNSLLEGRGAPFTSPPARPSDPLPPA